MGRYIGKNTSKKLSSKYSQQILEHSRPVEKVAEATGISIGTKAADKITLKFQKLHPWIIQK